jgi:phosphomannomutase
MNLSAFKAYDVRGRIPDEINVELARAIGRAYAGFVNPKQVVVGRDIRLTSATLADALIEGLLESGVTVADIGLCGTEGVYFATAKSTLQGGASGVGSGAAFDGGIMVTASHNPPDYNGMKFVREDSRPVSSDTGLREMAAMIREGRLPAPVTTVGGTRGSRLSLDTRTGYIDHLLGYVDLVGLRNESGGRRLKVVVNAGNGGAGVFVDLLEPHLPFEFIKVHHEAERRPEPHAGRKSLADHRGDPSQRSGYRPRLGWGFRPLFLF